MSEKSQRRKEGRKEGMSEKSQRRKEGRKEGRKPKKEVKERRTEADEGR